MASGSSTAKSAVPALSRGYCHICAKEVDALEVEDGEFFCSECSEVGCVEVLDGAAHVPDAEPPSSGSNSRPAPQADMFQNANVMGAAMTNFMTGFAGAMAQQPQAVNRGSVNNVNELEQLGMGFLGAMQQGIQHAAQNTEGVTANDRQWMEHHGAAVSNFVQERGRLLRSNPEFVSFLEQALGSGWQSQSSGMSEADVRKWVEEREIPPESVGPGGDAPGAPEAPGVSAEEEAPDAKERKENWTCPICCVGHEPGGAGLCLLCDGDGKSWHVFHKECAFNWLCHNDSCPICRAQHVMR